MTTALERYAKLEAVARYHDGTGAEPREVVLSFGSRTLMLLGMDDQPVGHWPLASLRALGPRGTTPVELAPDRASEERLVLDDAEMVTAIAAVCPDLWPEPVRRPPRTRRVLAWVLAPLGAIVFGLFVMLPEFAGQLAGLVPPDRERALGEAVAATLVQVRAPRRCVEAEGAEALRRMVARLAVPIDVAVLDQAEADALVLPGGRVLLSRGLIERAQSPEEVAAALAHVAGHLEARDPTRQVLAGAGTLGVAALIAGIGVTDIAAATEAVLTARHGDAAERAADAATWRILGAAGLPTGAFPRLIDRLVPGDAAAGAGGYAARHAGAPDRAERAAAADRVGGQPFDPALDDRSWIALGNICDVTAPLGR